MQPNYHEEEDVFLMPLQAKVGQKAPDFKVEACLKGEFVKVALEDYKDKWLVLFFYPLDFTFICPTEITAFSDRSEEFEALNTKVLGGSTDSVHSHKAWLKELGELNFPLFSDMTHEMSDAYGVLLPEEGIATRGTFIISPDGELKYALYHHNDVGRSIDETLRVLKGLQTGGLCPVNWEAGQKTLGEE